MAEPKLYAVFAPDGGLAHEAWQGTFAALTKWGAWFAAGFKADAAIRKAKRAGYTVEEVVIVRASEAGK